MISVVDLFCGAGGLTHGLQNAGLNVVAGYDIEASCRFAYEKNNDAVFLCKSVTEIERDELLSHYSQSQLRVLAGCAPCQPFSTYNQRNASNKKDSRWSLLYAFSQQVENADPDIVTMENVPGLTKQEVFRDFVNSLEKLGYTVWFDIVYCPDYGMAQTRSRLVLLASKHGRISLIRKTHDKNNYMNVKDVISHLPKLSAGSVDKRDPLHRASSLSELNMKRMKASKPGGTWRDWPENLVADCHKKSSGATFSGVYGRMKWDAPSSTITTQCMGFGNGRFGHPEQDRAITLREAALIQSFPNNYEFWPKERKFDTSTVAKMIGNAVPVRLGEVIGRSILSHIRSLNMCH